uniref:B3 domain-containing protein At1g05920-like n=1 Tax=Erigeron canadensis TaxID=72917 RepID=UPI001CB8B0C4|nr:B3 domain-containing protein At1g05920-like [Erigeron canadensis]
MERGPVVIDEQLKNFIVNEMNGSDIKLVIQKHLSYNDVSQELNRLTMPSEKLVTHDFLTYDESQVLATKNYDGIEVQLVGPTLQMYNQSISLRLWSMITASKHYVYVFKTNWYKFVTDNDELKPGTKIQVWSFRRNKHQLCFAVVCPDT